MRQVDRVPALRWLASLAVMACSSGHAVDLGWETALGYTHTDNIAQAPTGDSADILSAELSASLRHSTRTLDVDAEGNYLYRFIPDGDYASGSQPHLRAELEWTPLPDRLRLTLSDVYGQVALNPAEGLLPSDFEDANVFAAGTQLSWPISLDLRLQANGEFRDARFDESSVDTQRTRGELRLQRTLTRLIALFASVGRSHTEVATRGSGSQYDIDSALLGFDAVGRRSALQISAGVDRLDDDGESFSGSRYDLRYERQLSRATQVFASGTRELADSADVFSLAQISDPALIGIRDVQVTSQPMVRQQYLLGFALGTGHLKVSVAGGFRKERFERAPADAVSIVGVDRDINEAYVNVDYSWDPRNNLLGRVEVLREKYVNGLRSNDLVLGVSWLRRIAPRIGLEATVQHIDRSSSPLSFDELRILCMVRYTGRALPGERTDLFDRAFERRIRRIRDEVAPAEILEPSQ